MKKVFWMAMVCLLALPLSISADKQATADKETKQGKYDIECAGTGAAGTYLVRVSSYSKKQSIAESQCRKNAVHGVIFKGFGGGNGCVAQKAMAPAGAEQQFSEYFESFFATGGEFARYASIVNGTMTTEKIDKYYKVTVTVSVNKDDLRKALEEAGIIKKLNAGF